MDTWRRICFKIIQNYGSLTDCFLETSKEGIKVLEELNLPPEITKELSTLVTEKIKPKEIKITTNLNLPSNAPNGIEIIKKAIKKAQELAIKEKYKIKISYLGAPKYCLEVFASDYKIAEKEASKIAETITDSLKK